METMQTQMTCWHRLLKLFRSSVAGDPTVVSKSSLLLCIGYSMRWK